MKKGIFLTILGVILMVAGLVLSSMANESGFNSPEASLILSLGRSMGAMSYLSFSDRLLLWAMDNVPLFLITGVAGIVGGIVMINLDGKKRREAALRNGTATVWRCRKCGQINPSNRIACSNCLYTAL